MFSKIMIRNPSPQLLDLGYSHDRMLFYKETGDVSQEVWDVLLYRYLEKTDPTAKEQFYQAHMNGDDVTKQAMHEHYYPQTLESLQKHVGEFLEQLDELESKTYDKDTTEHPRLPVILMHNEFVKETFLAVKANL